MLVLWIWMCRLIFLLILVVWFMVMVMLLVEVNLSVLLRRLVSIWCRCVGLLRKIGGSEVLKV